MPPDAAHGQLQSGSTFARFRIEGVVGRGGMGIVYRATDLQLDRPVALKLITPELAEDERFRSRFLRESRTAASLDHPGVVPIYEAGEHDGQLFIAMRYVAGADLKTVLRQEGALAPDRTFAILAQVADALDTAHDKGLVHRDVKPGNVLLDGREHAYLTDFGLTKQLGGASTETGHAVGTFDYLAPEQIRGEAVDARTDGYSLACVVYECLSGKPPFHRLSEAEVLWAHMQEPPTPLTDYPALDPVFERALAKDPAERYGSCSELIDAGREALRIGTAEGVATIMFTDVEGSTALTTRLGDVAAKELIEEQRRIVRAQVAAHSGRVIDSIGDGFMVAFDSTRRALACALALQEEMLEHGRSDPGRALRLRIGLNSGEVLERAGHPFGAAVNAAQRIAAAAKGGQVLASDAVRQLAGTTPGVSFRDRGRVPLKGFAEAPRLYEIVPSELVEDRRGSWRRLQPLAARAVPRRLRVVRRLAVLAAVLVAGAIAAVTAIWVTDDAVNVEANEGVLASSACSEVFSGSLQPDLLIASDLTLRGANEPATRTMAEAIRFVLRTHGFKAGRYAVGYQSCDDSSAQTGTWDEGQCTSNAAAYARTTRLVAVIGPFISDCAAIEVPILNSAPDGPLAMISPSTTRTGLTRGGPGARSGEPEIYYPTGDRNFVRVVAADHVQGAASALLAKRLALRRVYVLSDGGAYGLLITTAFRRAARQLEVPIAGLGEWDPLAASHASLAEKVARSGADGVFLGGFVSEGGDRVVKALRARLGSRFTIIGGEGFHPIPEVLAAIGPAAYGMYVTVPGVPLDELGPGGLAFVRAFRAANPGRAIGAYVLEAAQAAEIVRQAIARSEGTRASVLEKLRSIEVSDGILGSFRFDRNGDISPTPVSIYRITGKTPAAVDVFGSFRGAVVDRVIHVPQGLSR